MSTLFFINLFALFLSLFVAGCILGAVFSPAWRATIAELVTNLGRRRAPGWFARSPANPLLEPGAHPWTAEAVFNPAAIVLGGRTHLVYRAIGSDGISRLGYASSADGITFDDRLPHPVFVTHNPRAGFVGARMYAPMMFPSGGSWGGCEDPRMVEIDGIVYLTYNAFDSWDCMRIALTSIRTEDFTTKRWWWRRPQLISRHGERHKNWTIFPEKIRGKFAVLHSIAPQVEVAYVQSLNDVGLRTPFIKSWVGARSDLPLREGVWDSRIRSAGPPPLKTEHGWLVFYHANDVHEPERYKLGALLLDLDDPTKILYRSINPVLEPDAWYENAGKPGIIYACGAVVRDGTLFVYYGGADKVVCVATARLDDFLRSLMSGEHAVLATQPTKAA